MDVQHCLWKKILNYTWVPEDIWGWKWEESNNHTKCPPLLKKILY